MEKNPRSGFARLFGGKGFYIALALALVAAGVGGYAALFGGDSRQPTDTAPDDGVALGAQDAVVAELPKDESTVPDIPPVTEPEHAVPTVEPQEIVLPEAEIPPEAPVIVVRPLEGEVVAAFSRTELTYDPTMEDWRVHSGMDIAAEEGTAVLAACSGVVQSVTDDALMGVTVVIEGEDGYVATYSNLQTGPCVLAGETVTAGSQIGAVGSTSKAEAAAPPHLHFSVNRGGELVDPAEYLS